MRGFLLFLFLFTAALHGESMSPVISLGQCGLNLKLTGDYRLYNKTKDSLLAIHPEGRQFTAVCNVNPERTSKTDSLYEQYAGDGKAEIVNLKNGFQAVLYSNARVIQGRKVEVIEAYTASRNYEYRFAVFQESSDADLIQDMRIMLGSVSMAPHIQKTISESDYQFRLNVFGITVLALAGYLLFLLVKWIVKRKQIKLKPPEEEKSEESKND